ncbi:MAG: methyltransferase domain-containing protein [Planctomycetota bacterium]|jgi:demethylmenaquinone methyltransferase/2-methoxy-6-polyprenyl-1,4-benzoquinol methylase
MERKIYKWWYDHIHSRFYDPLVKLLSVPFGGEAKFRRRMIAPVSFSENEKILDMCCGTGGATFYISEKAGKTCEITGTDMSTGQLKHARKRQYFCPTKFIEGDVEHTDFQNDTFDKVFIAYATHEMVRESRLAALREARRVLKPDGLVVVLDLDDPPEMWLRLLFGFLALYWLPCNFENKTRRDMFRHGLVNEVKEIGFSDVRKYSCYRGILQTVIGRN